MDAQTSNDPNPEEPRQGQGARDPDQAQRQEVREVSHSELDAARELLRTFDIRESRALISCPEESANQALAWAQSLSELTKAFPKSSRIANVDDSRLQQVGEAVAAELASALEKFQDLPADARNALLNDRGAAGSVQTVLTALNQRIDSFRQGISAQESLRFGSQEKKGSGSPFSDLLKELARTKKRFSDILEYAGSEDAQAPIHDTDCSAQTEKAKSLSPEFGAFRESLRTQQELLLSVFSGDSQVIGYVDGQSSSIQNDSGVPSRPGLVPIGSEQVQETAERISRKIEAMEQLLADPKELSGAERLYLILELRGFNGEPPALHAQLAQFREVAESVHDDGAYDRGLGELLLSVSENFEEMHNTLLETFHESKLELSLADQNCIAIVADTKYNIRELAREYAAGTLTDEQFKTAAEEGIREIFERPENAAWLIGPSWDHTRKLITQLVLWQAGYREPPGSSLATEDQLHRAEVDPDRGAEEAQKIFQRAEAGLPGGAVEGAPSQYEALKANEVLAGQLQKETARYNQIVTSQDRYFPDEDLMQKAGLNERSYSFKNGSMKVTNRKMEFEQVVVRDGKPTIVTETRLTPMIVLQGKAGSQIEMPLNMNELARRQQLRALEGALAAHHIDPQSEQGRRILERQCAEPTRLEQLNKEYKVLQMMRDDARDTQQGPRGVGEISMAMTEVGEQLRMEAERVLRSADTEFESIRAALEDPRSDTGLSGLRNYLPFGWMRGRDAGAFSSRTYGLGIRPKKAAVNFNNEGIRALLDMSGGCITSMQNLIVQDADLQAVDFGRVRHPGGSLENPNVVLSRVSFKRCNLSGARLSGYLDEDLINPLERSDKPRAVFAIEGVRFEDCRARDLEAAGLRWRKGCRSARTSFDHSNFTDAELGWSRFAWCSMQGDYFSCYAGSFSLLERSQEEARRIKPNGEAKPFWTRHPSGRSGSGLDVLRKQFKGTYFSRGGNSFGEGQRYMEAAKSDVFDEGGLKKWEVGPFPALVDSLEAALGSGSQLRGHRLTGSERVDPRSEAEEQYAVYRRDLDQRMIFKHRGGFTDERFVDIDFQQAVRAPNGEIVGWQPLQMPDAPPSVQEYLQTLRSQKVNTSTAAGVARDWLRFGLRSAGEAELQRIREQYEEGKQKLTHGHPRASEQSQQPNA